MLVIGREVGERIILDIPASSTPMERRVVEILVVRNIKGTSCRLGVEAPAEVNIVRDEVLSHENAVILGAVLAKQKRVKRRKPAVVA